MCIRFFLEENNAWDGHEYGREGAIEFSPFFFFIFMLKFKSRVRINDSTRKESRYGISKQTK